VEARDPRRKEQLGDEHRPVHCKVKGKGKDILDYRASGSGADTVLGSQPANDVSHKPGGSLPLLSARPAVTPATLKRAVLAILLLGKQRHDGCEQFA